jgi:hypothetical protein
MKLVNAAVLALAGVCLLLAQSDRGAITGRVNDPSKAAVAGATITVSNTTTGLRSTAKSNESGAYTVPQLPVGQY